jgi:hypothetical protein
MIPFWFIFSFIVFFSLTFPSFSKYKDNTLDIYFFSIFSGIILIVFAGFRFASNDYNGYVEIYNNIPDFFNLNQKWFIDNNLNVEIGFIYFCSILKLITSNPLILFIAVSTISVTLNFWTINKLSPYIFLSILLYYVYNYLLKETIQIRQGLTSALLMTSFLYYNNRIKSLILILFAITVQSTAAIALPFLLLNKILFKKNITYYYILAFVFLLSIIYSGRNAFEYIMNVMSLPPSLTVYFGWEEFDYNLGYINPILIKQIIISVLLIKNRNELIIKFPHFLMMFNFYIISTLWYMYFNDFAIIAGRISNLLSIGEVILIPMLISISNKNIRNYIYIAIILYSTVILILNLNSGKIFPYQSIFTI